MAFGFKPELLTGEHLELVPYPRLGRDQRRLAGELIELVNTPVTKLMLNKHHSNVVGGYKHVLSAMSRIGSTAKNHDIEAYQIRSAGGLLGVGTVVDDVLTPGPDGPDEADPRLAHYRLIANVSYWISRDPVTPVDAVDAEVARLLTERAGILLGRIGQASLVAYSLLLPGAEGAARDPSKGFVLSPKGYPDPPMVQSAFLGQFRGAGINEAVRYGVCVSPDILNKAA